MRILFVSDEVEPFSKVSETAKLVRTIPEKLQDSGDFEVRIMMPRYGTISERKNRLHEVIRLSGTEILMGDRKETLKVKVASIPGIRLQVYFMDSNHYFKRKGVYTNKQGDAFEDNAERALFFGRAALETIRNLGWRPDIVHAFGWMSGFVPMLLQSDFAADPLFEEAKSVYTPGGVDHRSPISEAFASTFGLNGAAKLGASSPVHVGREYADALVLSASTDGNGSDPFRFSGPGEESVEVTRMAYEHVMSEVAA